jgi:hypothetical protein
MVESREIIDRENALGMRPLAVVGGEISFWIAPGHITER